MDWDARFAEFESRLINAKTSRQFAILAGQLLEVARDAHIRIKVDTFLKADGETFASFRRSVRPNMDFDLLETNSTSVSIPQSGGGYREVSGGTGVSDDWKLVTTGCPEYRGRREVD